MSGAVLFTAAAVRCLQDAGLENAGSWRLAGAPRAKKGQPAHLYRLSALICVCPSPEGAVSD